ncbi:hypothetical protein PGT21_019823 [Puccinia graminis f. sp. tritici]|uniref:Uncharacterized protein n=1 Tax=Puccinia graminis f. sp. tritici TaxID=56615 RepID=A0A5B0P7B1_PUCGR|nr:hypothetical protein PGT21_019823 [Puccinia graminis f. sp. tritici]
MHSSVIGQLCLIPHIIILKALVGNNSLRVKASEQLAESQAYGSYITGYRNMPTQTDPWDWKVNMRYKRVSRSNEICLAPKGLESWKNDSC